MKKTIYLALLAGFTLGLAATGLSAQSASITYVEGSARIKSAAGRMRAADFGGTVSWGESVITGRDGLVEFQLKNGSDIKVMENSVFSYSSTGTGANTQNVLATTAGRVSYKLHELSGEKPVIQTNSMVAGVRGTEFTVYAGRDGSVLLAVTQGIVDVKSQGQSVTLNKNEAVEVGMGKAPGEKFAWLGKEKDFSSWNQGKMDTFLADPELGLEKVAIQLEEYHAALAALKKPYEDATALWQAASDDYKKVLAAGDKDAIKAFQSEKLFPAQDARATLILNIRYWALNYLSVRRYVLSNMYMEMKSRNPIHQSPAVQKFFARHAELLALYEENIVPELNTNDY